MIEARANLALLVLAQKPLAVAVVALICVHLRRQ
jgi:hypothetical protein